MDLKKTKRMIDIGALAGIVRRPAEIDYDFEAAISIQIKHRSCPQDVSGPVSEGASPPHG